MIVRVCKRLITRITCKISLRKIPVPLSNTDRKIRLKMDDLFKGVVGKAGNTQKKFSGNQAPGRRLRVKIGISTFFETTRKKL